MVRLQPRGKDGFIQKIRRGGWVLDVGCGNDSPAQFKKQRPDIVYVGIDVGDYNQTLDPTHYADEYILASPEGFAQAIAAFAGKCDAVVSAHNLEHCLDPDAVLESMLAAVKPGGRLYIAFPCEASIRFPQRDGSLNFYDDATHRLPPDYEKTLAQIESAGFHIEFARRRYRPWALFLMGLVLEPVSHVLKRTMPMYSTWAFYGFETIIWAERPL
ncbi:MAG TPA: class I SAM-dependent methyltransferase [Gammaproteobacteria bacterium]|nr:class I SAM-dependent methyltransferase [Gammaproteobacteria bacterium]